MIGDLTTKCENIKRFLNEYYSQKIIKIESIPLGDKMKLLVYTSGDEDLTNEMCTRVEQFLSIKCYDDYVLDRSQYRPYYDYNMETINPDIRLVCKSKTMI
jgi:hypothetical protein